MKKSGSLESIENHSQQTNNGLSSTSAKGLPQFNGRPGVYPAGTELFRQGTTIQTAYFITQGTVKLTRLEQDGQQTIVDLRFPGWVLGAAAIIAHQPSPVSAITLTKCYLEYSSTETFRQRLQADVQFAWQLLQMQSQETISQIDRTTQLACLSARQRLRQILWRLSQALEPGEARNPVRLQVPLKDWELAQLLAITPSYLSRVLRQLEQEELLTRAKGWFVITDLEQLWPGPDR